MSIKIPQMVAGTILTATLTSLIVPALGANKLNSHYQSQEAFSGHRRSAIEALSEGSMTNVVALKFDNSLEVDVQRVRLRDGIDLTIRSWEDKRFNSHPYVLLILHGLGGHSGYYDYFGPLLAGQGALVCAVDRRGQGMSGGPRGEISSLKVDLLDLEEVITWIQNRYPAKKIYLLGESWGCLVALAYVSHTNDKIAGLILASPPVRLRINHKWIKPSLMLALDIAKNILALDFNGKIGAPFPLEIASRDPRFFEKVRVDKYTNFQMTMRSGIRVLCLLKSAKRYGAQVNVPTLILQGESDKLLDSKGAIGLFRIIPTNDKEFVWVKGAYHTLYYDPATPSVVENIIKWVSARAKG